MCDTCRTCCYCKDLKIALCISCICQLLINVSSLIIRIDINAVKNGIKLKYNNGLAEGSVNKIKVIKRIMYGRNSFDLLKAKVLLHEQFRCEFN